MKDKKLNQLFAAARSETSPAVPAGFAERVQRSLAAEAEPVVIGFIDQINRNFTRYAVSAAAAIMLCAAVELNQSFQQEPSIDDDVEQICSDWMLR
ncbi:MAG: hypothetical protein IPP19_12335 [Verrucomicrobia bacterium]|nr:hypothetical protein [Verrucomicrobiota bacterium]